MTAIMLGFYRKFGVLGFYGSVLYVGRVVSMEAGIYNHLYEIHSLGIPSYASYLCELCVVVALSRYYGYAAGRYMDWRAFEVVILSNE